MKRLLPRTRMTKMTLMSWERLKMLLELEKLRDCLLYPR
jgi:hypothetical protein